MGEPVDPNAHPGYEPPSYQPPGYQPPGYQPPGYQPPPSYGPPPAYTEPSQPGTGYPFQPGTGYQPGYTPEHGPYGAPPWPPAEPPRPSGTRRTALIAGAVVVLALAGGGVGWYLTSGDAGPHRVGAPQSFDGYSRLTDSTAHRVESSMRALGDAASGGAAKKIFDAATIAVYAKNSGDQPVLITLALPTSSASDGESSEAITSGLLQGAVPDSSVYSSGSHGGVTRCGEAQFGAAAESMCAWSDPKTSGVLVSVNPPAAPAALAQVSVDFRDEIE